MSASRRSSPGSNASSATSDVGSVDQQLAHVADVEQARAFARPQMLGHDAFVLERHLIARERDHARAFGPVPAIERELLDLLGSDARAAFGIAAQGLAACLVLVGRTAVDFSAQWTSRLIGDSRNR